jgi:hypothetical protein
MLPAGEIPAPERGTSRPTGNRALGSWRQRHELSVGASDERAVTQVKRLSLVMIVTRRPTASYWLEGNSRSPQEAMVTGDCGGSESTARSETEALRNLRDPRWSRLVAETSRVCWTNGTFLRKANAAVEVGFAGSTQSAGKLRTRGSGEADEG